MEHIGVRIRRYRDAKGLTQVDIFRDTGGAPHGIKQTTLSSIEGGTEPKAGVVAALLSAYSDINPDWLLIGKGEMFRQGVVAEPFVPGGKTHYSGATILPKGGKEHAFGAGFGEEMEGSHVPSYPKTREEFINSILREADDLRDQLKQTNGENAKLHRVIEELQATVRTSQEQLSLLLGKPTGNQYLAPGTYVDVEPTEQPARTRAGYRFYDEPLTDDDTCVMRHINSAPIVREFTFGVSEKEAA